MGWLKVLESDVDSAFDEKLDLVDSSAFDVETGDEMLVSACVLCMEDGCESALEVLFVHGPANDLVVELAALLSLVDPPEPWVVPDGLDADGWVPELVALLRLVGPPEPWVVTDGFDADGCVLELVALLPLVGPPEP